MSFFGLFGGKSPQANQQPPLDPTQPRPISTGDVMLDVFLRGGSPAINRAQLEAAQQAEAEKAQIMQARRQWLSPSDQSAAPAAAPQVNPSQAAAVASTQPNAANSAIPSPKPGLIGGSAPAPAAVAPAATPATASSRAGLPKSPFYNDDGTPREYSDLVHDPRIAAMNTTPAGQAFLKQNLENWKDARDEYTQGPGDTMVSKYNPNRKGPEQHKAPPGSTAVYDANGNVVDFRPMPSYNNIVGNTERATSDARNASEASYAGPKAANTARGAAPYTPDNRQDSTGAPVYGVVGDRFGNSGGPMSGQGLTGQSSGDKAMAEDKGKLEIKRSDDIRQAGEKAQAAITTVRQLRSLDNQITTGALSSPNVIYNTANAMGIKIAPNLGAAQAYQALASGFALENRSKLPGPMSNADRDYLERLSPSIGKDPAANKILLDAMEKAALNTAKIAQQRAMWDSKIGIGKKNEHGDTFDEWQNKFLSMNSIFPGQKK